MSTIRLLFFECKQQIKSLTFIAVITLFAVFAVSQLTEIFHLPIVSNRDIQTLSQLSPEVNQYVYTINTNGSEVKTLSRDFLQRQVDDISFSPEVAVELQAAIYLLNDDAYSFDDVMAAMAEYEYAPDWLYSCKAQFGKRLMTVCEANQNIQAILGVKGYTPLLYKNYVTYMQAISAFLILPVFLFIYTRDYRHGMYEIVYAQPISANKYLIFRHLSAFIPIAIFIYILGVTLNLVSVCRFATAGIEYQYTFFAPYFLLYILPALFFMSVIITLLMLLIRKAAAILPIYILYVLFNVTPGMFTFGMKNTDWLYIINPVIRLDNNFVWGIHAMLINRVIYLCLGSVFMLLSCLFYKKLRGNLKGAITL